MNILNKECKAMAPTFGNKKVCTPKREKFSWAEPCEPGTFMMINKNDLNIDGSYQREEVSKLKILEIAREWDWKLFGTLSVIRRNDGTFWVYDGGHRCRSSFMRDDIIDLPCMVFKADNEKTEVKAFIGTNTMKSSVSAYHKHRAAVKAGEPIALTVQAIIDKNGYYATQTPKKKYGFAAINTLKSLVKEDSVLAEKSFSACVSIAQDGEQIPGEVLSAVFVCQKKLEHKANILANDHLKRMQSVTLPGIEAAIRREKHIIGKGGALVAAKALLDLLNKNKHRRLTFD